MYTHNVQVQSNSRLRGVVVSDVQIYVSLFIYIYIYTPIYIQHTHVYIYIYTRTHTLYCCNAFEGRLHGVAVSSLQTCV